jgi:hypothetical protein
MDALKQQKIQEFQELEENKRRQRVKGSIISSNTDNPGSIKKVTLKRTERASDQNIKIEKTKEYTELKPLDISKLSVDELKTFNKKEEIITATCSSEPINNTEKNVLENQSKPTISEAISTDSSISKDQHSEPIQKSSSEYLNNVPNSPLVLPEVIPVAEPPKVESSLNKIMELASVYDPTLEGDEKQNKESSTAPKFFSEKKMFSSMDTKALTEFLLR